MTTRINAARAAIGDNGYEQRLIKTVRRRGFRFVASVREIEASPLTLFAAQSVLNKPSLAVLTFRNGDQDQSRFAAGLAEQLASLLCKSPWLSVSALAGAFARHADILTPRVRYLLGGSVRNSASTLRVS